MLVLTREVNECIVILKEDGTRIEVKVVEVADRSGCKMVRLGVDAPREVPVHRFEVYKRIKDGEQCKLHTA